MRKVKPLFRLQKLTFKNRTSVFPTHLNENMGTDSCMQNCCSDNDSGLTYHEIC